MSKRAKITGTYRLDEDQLIQVSVEVPNAYPDVIAEAEACVLRMLSDELADVLEQQYGKTRDDKPINLVWPEQDAE
jgi:hypothetical protein